ncbi:properdin-like [Antedon mediterranea]|uniref:properdin-like n=1 Tax=Antedon mediterranea TaxID=105859 RepID=UPI003AF9D751
MVVGRNRIAFIFMITLSLLLPTVSSYCFKTYKKKTTGDYDFRCRTRLNDLPGGSLEDCCSNVQDSVGFSTNVKGKYCEICESALSEEDITPVWSQWGAWSGCSRTCDVGIETRTRQCEQGICDGSTTEQRECVEHQHCPIDGEWGNWVEWSTCSTTCSVGIRSRSRICDSPAPQYNGRTCLQIGGDSVEQEDCVETENCPINGIWGNWQPYSACSATCGSDAFRTRDRACDNPPPQYGGNPCPGESRSTHNCGFGLCPIDGGWSSWSPWTGCSKTCGDGRSVRKRSCNNPRPQHNGKPCNGEDTGRETCNLRECIKPVDWTEWSDWSDCLDCETYGQQRRTRICPVTADSKIIKCDGSSLDIYRCTSVDNCKKSVSDAEGSGSGDGCVGDDCCDDPDGCSDGSSSNSFSSSNDESSSEPPPPDKCKRFFTPAPDNSISDSLGDSISVSVSQGSDSNAASFEWVDCPEDVTPTPADDCRDSNSNNCAFSDYYDYSDDESDKKPTPAGGGSSSISDYDASSSDSNASPGATDAPDNGGGDENSLSSSYVSSGKDTGGNGGGGNAGGGGQGSFSSSS